MSARTIQIEKFRQHISDETSPVEAAEFLVSQMLVRPDGALYAKWDAQKNEVLWRYSADHTAIFEWPEHTETLLRQSIRGIFRSVVFRMGSLGAEEQGYVPLCGYYFIEYLWNERRAKRKVMVHADFGPEFGVWIKATFLAVADE